MSCKDSFTAEADLDVVDGYTDYPPYLCPPNNLSGFEDIGTQVMDAMILTQYVGSPNLIEYMGAYIKEMDTLLEQIHKVELGRYIANAEGAQLDVIGVILQQTRNIAIDLKWFGFQGHPQAGKMSDEVTPLDGFSFIGEDDLDYDIIPLDDISYRNLLLGRALCITTDIFSVDRIYEIIETIIGTIPRYLGLIKQGFKHYKLLLDDASISVEQLGILQAVTKWYIPMGIQLDISINNIVVLNVVHNGIQVTHNGDPVTFLNIT